MFQNTNSREIRSAKKKKKQKKTFRQRGQEDIGSEHSLDSAVFFLKQV